MGAGPLTLAGRKGLGGVTTKTSMGNGSLLSSTKTSTGLSTGLGAGLSLLTPSDKGSSTDNRTPIKKK